MAFIFLVLAFLLGLIIGSFLNVVILRMHTARSLGGRSACMSCNSKLCWYELIPLFSFLGLRGRCLNCKTKISIQYPLVELLTGLVFATIFWKFQNLFYMDVLDFILTFKYYAIMFSLLIVIAVYDLKHKIIPDVLSFVFGLLAFLGMFFFSNFNLNVHVPSLLEFLSGMIVAGPFAFFWLVSRGRWMGLGDAKLALGIGWLLGVPFALSGLALSFWFGAIIGVALILVSRSSKEGRLGMKSEIPFAPFLVLGTFLAFVCELNIFGF